MQNTIPRAFIVSIILSCGALPSLAQPYKISTVAGTDRLLDGKSATSAPLRTPLAVAVDNQGNLYIADRDDNRVRKVSPANIITTLAGTGVPGYSGDRGKATLAQLASPTGVAVDLNGNVYIADHDNFAVRRVSPDGTINTVAGNGTLGFSGDGATATSAQVAPYAVAVDPQGNLYISDVFSFRIRKVDAKGIITTIAGNGTEGYSGDNDSALNASIDFVTGMVADATGNIYIATFERVRKIDAAGKITTVAGSGDFGFIVDGVDATQAVMLPAGVALGNGVLYISDLNSDKVRKVDLLSHQIGSAAGNGSFGFSGDQGSPNSAELNGPFGLAVDSSNQLFIADIANGRIRKVSGSTISTVAGTGIGDGGLATSAFLNLPTGLAIDGVNNIVAADTGNFAARRFALGGTIGAFGQLQLGSIPVGVASDQAGNFYVTDDEPRILKISSSGATTIVAGSGTDGYEGDKGPATSAPISQPTGVAVDTANNVYFTDFNHNRIRKVTPGGTITTIAGNGKFIYSGDNAPAVSAGMDPFDVAADNKLNVYVADRLNNRIRKITPDGMIATVVGTGVPGYSGDGGLATAAQLNSPGGVAADTAGNLYIADTGNRVVRRVTASGLITTIAGNGGFYPSTGDGGPAIAAQIDPLRVAVDGSGNVYVSDAANDRVRKLTPQGVIPAAMNVVSGSGQQGGVGATLAAALVVKITDSKGAGAAGIIVTFAASPGGAATFSSSPAITLNDGTASTMVTLGNIAGAVTITASAAGVPNVSFSVTVLSPTAPAITSGGIVSAGLSAPAVTALAVNSIATLFGSQFAAAGSSRQVGPSDLVNGKVPTILAGVCVVFGGQRAPIFAVFANQLNVQVPQAGPGAVSVQVITKCDTPQAETSNAVIAQIQAAAPEFFYFTHNADGHNAIAALNAVTGGYVGAPGLISGAAFIPAATGDYLTLFATGFGSTSPSFGPGELPGAAATVTAPVTISFGGLTLAASDILYVGVTTNAGVYQVNIHVPAGIPAGDQAFIITIGGVSSPATAYITVRAPQ